MDKTQLHQDFRLFITLCAEDYKGRSEIDKCHICHLKMDKIQLFQDFGLFDSFFTEDYTESSEEVKMLYMQTENGQSSSGPRFWIFTYFFCQTLYREIRPKRKLQQIKNKLKQPNRASSQLAK